MRYDPVMTVLIPVLMVLDVAGCCYAIKKRMFFRKHNIRRLAIDCTILIWMLMDLLFYGH